MSAPATELDTAKLFALIWHSLVRVLGTAATATLVRRAARAAAARAPHHPDLARLLIVREEMEYRYSVPSSWNRDDAAAHDALRFLVQDQLLPLLGELAGPVGTRLIERIPALRRHGVVSTGDVEE